MARTFAITLDGESREFTIATGVGPVGPVGPIGATGATGADSIVEGPAGPANTLSIASVTTGAAGSAASVTVGGTSPAQTLTFSIPQGLKGDTGDIGATGPSGATGPQGLKGDTGDIGATGPQGLKGDTGETGSTGPIGPATQFSVASTTTGAAGSNASVTISGTAPNQSLAFTIPTGPQGPQGPTGSSGATALLTGYVSGAGTVAATDTVIQAVGKLNGNDELKAPIASLYPYIGGKLLTYLDEEAAIADPLISAGDIYRKSAGGVDFVNPDNVPSLDLRFATDKTLTARRGPTPVFTRASTATFVGSDGLIQSAAVNAPRFDHDPLTLACKGLLIEEGRTNSVADSNSFNNWVNLSSTVATSSVATPEGTADAWKVVEDSLLNIHTVSRAFTPVSGTTYAASVWLKPAENGFAFVGLAGGGFAPTFISVNLSTGAVSTALGTPIGASSVSHSNGWWRVSFSLAATASLSSIIAIRLSRDGNWANSSYLGNGVNGMYVYGAQVEAGSFPTSYIPTTTAPLARSADVCSITGDAFSGFYNSLAGSLYCESIRLNTITAYGSIIGISDGSAANQIGIRDGGSVVSRQYLINRSGVLWFDSLHNGASSGPRKMALAYQPNDANRADSGVLGENDSTVQIPTVNRLTLGNNQIVASIRYYKKRLSNFKLQSLTS